MKVYASLDKLDGVHPRPWALVLLTGFGGHEQMLLKHLASSERPWRLIVLHEKAQDLSALQAALPERSSIEYVRQLPAYPPLRDTRLLSHLLTLLREVSRWPHIDLVSAGDIGNYYFLQLLLCVRQRGQYWTYVPMPPPENSIPCRIGRFAARRLITISAHVGQQFKPPAVGYVPNSAPGHLLRIGKQIDRTGGIEVYWIGRLERHQKQPYRALDVLASTREIGLPCRLNFLGDGPERDALTAEAQRRGLADLVSFHGWVDFSKPKLPELPPIGALLNTSDFEGVPLTILDALSLDVPCLVRDGAIQDPDLLTRVNVWLNPDEAALALSRTASNVDA